MGLHEYFSCCRAVHLYSSVIFSEHSFAAANPGQNGPEISKALSFNNGSAYSEKKADGPKTPGTENDSLPSTSKRDPDGKDCRSEARPKLRTYSGPILQSGPHNNSMTERDRIIERCALQT